jgi:predicted ribosomally synthesized peptide with nif11-like leader
MNRAELNRLREDLRQDSRLLDESRGLLQDPDALLRWTQEKGFLLTPGDIQELLSSDQELSDDELDKAAGGDTAWPPPPGSGG